MTLYLTTLHKASTRQHMVRLETSSGRIIAQAVDRVEDRARQRAIRQAHAWAKDHGWGALTIKQRPAT